MHRDVSFDYSDYDSFHFMFMIIMIIDSFPAAYENKHTLPHKLCNNSTTLPIKHNKRPFSNINKKKNDNNG